MSNREEEEELDELEANARQVPDDLAKLERGPEAFRTRMRQAAARKQQVTIRLDADIVTAFKQMAGEGSYQTLINRALHEWLDAKSVRGLLEEAIEAIVRERKAHG